MTRPAWTKPATHVLLDALLDEGVVETRVDAAMILRHYERSVDPTILSLCEAAWTQQVHPSPIRPKPSAVGAFTTLDQQGCRLRDNVERDANDNIVQAYRRLADGLVASYQRRRTLDAWTSFSVDDWWTQDLLCLGWWDLALSRDMVQAVVGQSEREEEDLHVLRMLGTFVDCTIRGLAPYRIYVEPYTQLSAMIAQHVAENKPRSERERNPRPATPQARGLDYTERQYSVYGGIYRNIRMTAAFYEDGLPPRDTRSGFSWPIATILGEIEASLGEVKLIDEHGRERTPAQLLRQYYPRPEFWSP